MPLEHVTIGQAAAAIAVFAALYGFIRKVLPGARKLGHLIDALVGVPEEGRLSIVQKVDATAATVELIRKQVYPNGGASLPDRVGELATGQEAIVAQIAELAEAHSALAAFQTQRSAAIEALTARFDGIESRLSTIHDDTRPSTPADTPSS